MSQRRLTTLAAALTLTLALALVAPAAHAKRHARYDVFTPLTPAQSALINRAIVNERTTIQEIRKSTPVVQTYIQNMRPNPQLYAVPVSDDYSLARVDFNKAFTADNYIPQGQKRGWFSGTKRYLADLTKSFYIHYSQTGFMDMMFLDPTGFNRQNYEFNFVRKQFLGSVLTSVFDVRPKPTVRGYGRFFGRIWIEDQGGHIVRFNGTYTGNKNGNEIHYFHFDSWRTNIQPGEWLPTAIYVQETHHSADRHATGFRAQTYFWGYSLKLPQQQSANESIVVENAEDQSAQGQDVSPLEAQRMWVTQAQDNVLDRLTQAGLLAPPSPFDKVLETVTNNIAIGSKLNLPAPIQCRVLLTEPLESLAIGNTIILSKGLIDSLPTEADLAAVLSFQLAHIVLGHHLDTRYAFDNELLFPDDATFQRINMKHSLVDDQAAAKKAVELFNASVYAPKAGEVGLFFEQLAARQKALTALLTPQLGDSLLRPDGTPWLSGLTHNAPRLEPNNLNQIAALPLGSHLIINPWSDQVTQLHPAAAQLLNAGDKMPFQVTPIYYRLEYYQPPATAPAAAPQGQNAEPSQQTPAPQEQNAAPQQQQTAPQEQNIPPQQTAAPQQTASPQP